VIDCVYAEGVCENCGAVLRSTNTRRNCVSLPQHVRSGLPGTELKKLLAIAGIVADESCPCNARAVEMDRNGPAWCEANIDTIVGWLREQAQARGLPFIDAAGRMLVRRAIRNAERRTLTQAKDRDNQVPPPEAADRDSVPKSPS